jgi:amidase
VGELHDLTALEQGRAVRAGEVSPVELTRHYLDRTDRLGPAAGAFTTVTAELALVAAGVAEQRVRAAAPGEDLGPLFGVVVPVKDLTQVAGVRTTFGSRAFADAVGAVDDHVMTLLRAAGTVLTGLTTAPEFGLPCYTEPDPEVAAPARTPYDPTRTAGGSSGGAAVAVAAGLAPVALGNDGGGSPPRAAGWSG